MKKLFVILLLMQVYCSVYAQKPAKPNVDSIKLAYNVQVDSIKQALNIFRQFKKDTLERYPGLSSDKTFIKYSAGLNRQENAYRRQISILRREESGLLRAQKIAYDQAAAEHLRQQDFYQYKKKEMAYKVPAIVGMGLGAGGILYGILSAMVTAHPKPGYDPVARQKFINGNVKVPLIAGGAVMLGSSSLLIFARKNEKKYERAYSVYMQTAQLPNHKAQTQLGFAMRF